MVHKEIIKTFSHYQFIYCVKRNYQFSYSYMMHENYILALCNTNKIVNQKPINPIWQLNHNSSRVSYHCIKKKIKINYKTPTIMLMLMATWSVMLLYK
jgi:hypothetical protein